MIAHKRLRTVPAIIVLCIVLVIFGAKYLPPAVDWVGVFRPATLALARLENPYQNESGFYNAPWTLVFLMPFAADEIIGRAAIFVVSFATYGLLAVHMKASRLALVAFLLSPPILHTALHGNLEWLALAGLLLPPRWGLFFVTIKPQIGSMVAVYWIAEAWREGSWRCTLWLLWPIGAAYLLSFVIFGLWPLRAVGQIDLWWNASFWPYSIPLGLIALAWSIRKRDIRGALIASPCLSPYVLLHAWSGALLAVLRHQKLTLSIVAAIWIAALRNIF